MKVLHIYDTMGFGGLEMLALDLCKNARKYGMDLTAIFSRKGDNEEAYRNSGVNYYLFDRKKTFDYALYKNIKRVIEKENFDVIHTHQLIMSFYAYVASRGRKVKLVQSFHGNIKGIRNHLFKNFLVNKFNANISVSEGFLEQLKIKSKLDIGKNFFVVYNGIDKDKFKNQRGKLRKELNLSKKVILAGTVANFYNPVRDQITICKALKIIKEKGIKLKFVFIGDKNKRIPHYYDDCLNYCNNNDLTDDVYFLGKRNDVDEILCDLDIFVFSSVGDSFGISVVEAMMSGVPVVVSDISPMYEVTNNGEYGLIFKKRNPEDLSEKILYLYYSYDKRIFLAEKGKKFATEKFSISKYVSNLNDIYKKL